MKKILVTGGAGFMGSNMIRYLLRHYPDYIIVNVDKLTYAGNLKNLQDLADDPRYHFYRADIADRKYMDDLFARERFDFVLNYAAETHVDRSIMDPDAFLYTDIIGTFTLLEAMKKYGAERMVQISTDEVFGSTLDGAFHEGSPFQPNSPYSASKAGADHLCRAYFMTYQTPVIVTHSCNFYGPYQYPEKFIPLFITNLLEDKKVPMYGDGKYVREWIYTEDHCRAIDAVLHKGKIGEVYNIGTGHEKENLEVTNLLLRFLDKDDSYIEFIKDRPGHDRRYAIDATKIRSELGWAPLYSFAEGLEAKVRWYQENMTWWKELKNGDYLEYYRQQYHERLSI